MCWMAISSGFMLEITSRLDWPTMALYSTHFACSSVTPWSLMDSWNRMGKSFQLSLPLSNVGLSLVNPR